MAERIFRGFLFLGRRIFSRIFSPDYFSSFLWEKCPGKILQGNPRQNPPKFIQQKSPTHFCRGAGPMVTPEHSWGINCVILAGPMVMISVTMVVARSSAVRACSKLSVGRSQAQKSTWAWTITSSRWCARALVAFFPPLQHIEDHPPPPIQTAHMASKWGFCMPYFGVCMCHIFCGNPFILQKG